MSKNFLLPSNPLFRELNSKERAAFEQVLTAYKEQQYKKQVRLLEPLLSSHKKNPILRTLYNYAKFNIAESKAIRDECIDDQRSIAQSPEGKLNALITKHLADMLRSNCDPEGAYQASLTAYTIQPDSQIARDVLCDALACRQYEQAFQFCEKHIANDRNAGKDPTFLTLRLYTAMILGLNSEAESSLRTIDTLHFLDSQKVSQRVSPAVGDYVSRFRIYAILQIRGVEEALAEFDRYSQYMLEPVYKAHFLYDITAQLPKGDPRRASAALGWLEADSLSVEAMRAVWSETLGPGESPLSWIDAQWQKGTAQRYAAPAHRAVLATLALSELAAAPADATAIDLWAQRAVEHFVSRHTPGAAQLLLDALSESQDAGARAAVLSALQRSVERLIQQILGACKAVNEACAGTPEELIARAAAFCEPGAAQLSDLFRSTPDEYCAALFGGQPPAVELGAVGIKVPGGRVAMALAVALYTARALSGYALPSDEMRLLEALPVIAAVGQTVTVSQTGYMSLEEGESRPSLPVAVDALLSTAALRLSDLAPLTDAAVREARDLAATMAHAAFMLDPDDRSLHVAWTVTLQRAGRIMRSERQQDRFVRINDSAIYSRDSEVTQLLLTGAEAALDWARSGTEAIAAGPVCDDFLFADEADVAFIAQCARVAASDAAQNAALAPAHSAPRPMPRGARARPPPPKPKKVDSGKKDKSQKAKAKMPTAPPAPEPVKPSAQQALHRLLDYATTALSDVLFILQQRPKRELSDFPPFYCFKPFPHLLPVLDAFRFEHLPHLPLLRRASDALIRALLLAQATDDVEKKAAIEWANSHSVFQEFRRAALSKDNTEYVIGFDSWVFRRPSPWETLEQGLVSAVNQIHKGGVFDRPVSLALSAAAATISGDSDGTGKFLEQLSLEGGSETSDALLALETMRVRRSGIQCEIPGNPPEWNQCMENLLKNKGVIFIPLE